ncbi:glycosyltransferase family 2 protein [Paraburkholderia mimosarum]|uniref:glycosyltransferase family 2 protein n=1 Tax=Paraburkholderia mimosarum TaxID=312026 RepID=UPI0009DFB816|nr:glycosyltransferase family 2 protein [Paraburkholderia mimosarum]
MNPVDNNILSDTLPGVVNSGVENYYSRDVANALQTPDEPGLRWEGPDCERAPVSRFTRTLHSVTDFAKAHVRRIAHARQLSRARISPSLKDATHVVVLTVYNEALRLEALLKHYRSLGIDEFIIVDNRSTDGVAELLEGQPSVSYFYADGEYRRTRYGVDWVNAILSKYCHRKWILFVDADEFLVFPRSDVTSVRMLTDHFERSGQQSMNVLMLDMYSERPSRENQCGPGVDPLSVCALYDSSGYRAYTDSCTRTTWIRGGVRGRVYFNGALGNGPALNKTVLIHWRRHYAFLKSAHEVWPYRINAPRARTGGKVSGALLHFKFLGDMAERMNAEAVRQQHTAEYAAYTSRLGTEAVSTNFVGPLTARFASWRSLVRDRLIVGDGEWY